MVSDSKEVPEPPLIILLQVGGYTPLDGRAFTPELQSISGPHSDGVPHPLEPALLQHLKWVMKQGKARQLYLYSTVHTRGRLKVLHV